METVTDGVVTGTEGFFFWSVAFNLCHQVERMVMV